MRFVLRRILPLAMVPIVLCLVLGSALVTADGGVVIKSTTYENAFPKTITFRLSAQSDSDIARVRLNYRFLGDNASTNAYPDFKPGKTVNVEHVLNVQKKYFAPDSDIQFYWEVETAGGVKQRSDLKTFTASDTRFQWSKVDSGLVSLRWYKGDEAFARSLLEYATKAVDQLGKDIGVKPKAVVKILIYASNADLLGALEPGAHEWTGGVSFSEEGIIVIDAAPTASGKAFAARAVPHELSHVVVHQVTDNPYGGLPRWLDEGLAMYAEGKLEPSYQKTLDDAVKADDLLSLKTLSSSFPSDSDLAHLSYSESHSVVKFILDRYGREKMTRLLAVFSEGNTYDDALRAALGIDMRELESQWRTNLGLRPELPVAEPTPADTKTKRDLCGASTALGTLGALGAAYVAARSRPKLRRQWPFAKSTVFSRKSIDKGRRP